MILAAITAESELQQPKDPCQDTGGARSLRCSEPAVFDYRNANLNPGPSTKITQGSLRPFRGGFLPPGTLPSATAVPGEGRSTSIRHGAAF